MLAVEIGLWRIDDEPLRLQAGRMPNESRLEELIETAPDILGQPLLIIGRQVRTDFGKIIDLLAIDADGYVHILELKRDKTPREVVAQALDYASWVQTLDHEAVLDVYRRYGSTTSAAFEEAFAARFGGPPPDALNTGHHLTIIAADLDDASGRIVQYLAEQHGVPINVVFFRYFEDSGHRYLARTWLVEQTTATDLPRSGARTTEQWNGHDWYVSFGEANGGRSWDDAARYGFVSAGGGEWYARSIRKLPVWGRVFVYIPQTGYVAVGEVTGAPATFDSAFVTVDGRQERLAELTLAGSYQHEQGEEWVVPVRWLARRTRADAISGPGLYANQNSATKLRNQFTLAKLSEAFGLRDA